MSRLHLMEEIEAMERELELEDAEEQGLGSDVATRKCLSKEQSDLLMAAKLERCQKLYDDHARTKEKIEQIKAKVQAMECSFSPKITKKAQRKRAPGNGPRYEHLHNVAAVVEAKKQAKREELDPECKFSPQISRKAAIRAKQSSSNEDRFEKLYKTAEKQRANLKQKVEDQGREFSFSPRLVAKQGKYGSAKLYPSRDSLLRQKKSKEKKKEEHELKYCTFRPARIKTQFEPTGDKYVPLENRTPMVLAKKQSKVEAIRKMLLDEEMSHCFFTPFTTWERNELVHRPIPVLTKDESEQLCSRLYNEAARIMAKKQLLAQSWHFVEMHQGCIGKIDRHLRSWRMDRLSFLHEKGTKSVAEKLSRARDPNRRHSLDLKQDLIDLQESTFSPKLTPRSREIDPFGEKRQGVDSITSPRHIRLYNYHKVLLDKHQAQKNEFDAAIDKLVNTAFDAHSPDLRHQRKQYASEEETQRLYENARRIEERKERLYFELNRLARENNNIRFSANTISQFDSDMKSSGHISPGLLISPRSNGAQEHNLKMLYDRHDRKLKAMEMVHSLVEKTKEWKATTKYSSKTINKTLESLELSPTFNVRETQKIWQTVKPSHDTEKLQPPSPKAVASWSPARYFAEYIPVTVPMIQSPSSSPINKRLQVGKEPPIGERGIGVPPKQEHDEPPVAVKPYTSKKKSYCGTNTTKGADLLFEEKFEENGGLVERKLEVSKIESADDTQDGQQLHKKNPYVTRFEEFFEKNGLVPDHAYLQDESFEDEINSKHDLGVALEVSPRPLLDAMSFVEESLGHLGVEEEADFDERNLRASFFSKDTESVGPRHIFTPDTYDMDEEESITDTKVRMQSTEEHRFQKKDRDDNIDKEETEMDSYETKLEGEQTYDADCSRMHEGTPSLDDSLESLCESKLGTSESSPGSSLNSPPLSFSDLWNSGSSKSKKGQKNSRSFVASVKSSNKSEELSDASHSGSWSESTQSVKRAGSDISGFRTSEIAETSASRNSRKEGGIDLTSLLQKFAQSDFSQFPINEDSNDWSSVDEEKQSDGTSVRSSKKSSTATLPFVEGESFSATKKDSASTALENFQSQYLGVAELPKLRTSSVPKNATVDEEESKLDEDSDDSLGSLDFGSIEFSEGDGEDLLDLLDA